MIKLRKLLAALYLVAFVVLLAVLAGYWYRYGPIWSLLEQYRGDELLDYLMWGLFAIVIVGTVGYVVRTFTQRGKKKFQKTSTELGVVSISRAAIVREVNGVLAAHPEVKRLKTNVIIKNRRNPYAKVEVRVAPRGSLELPVVVAQLQREVKEAVERLTGNEVRSVSFDIRRGKDGDEADGKAFAAAKPAEKSERQDAEAERTGDALASGAITAEGEPTDAGESGEGHGFEERLSHGEALQGVGFESDDGVADAEDEASAALAGDSPDDDREQE